MSLDASKKSLRPITFVKIELTGLTLRFASENIYATDTDGIEYFWEGRVTDISPLISGFNDYRSSNALISSMQVTLSNGISNSSGSNLDTYVSSYFWGNKQVTIFIDNISTVQTKQISSANIGAWRVGTGDTVGASRRVGSSFSYTTPSQVPIDLTGALKVMKGIISFPNVFQAYTDQILQFSIFDTRYSDQVFANPNIFQFSSTETATTFPHAARQTLSRQIPIIYGDFTSYAVCTAYLVDNNAAPNRKFKLADSTRVASGQLPIFSITQVLVNSVAVAYLNTDTTNGNFTIDQNLFQESDSITVACKGKTRGTQITSVFGGSSASLLEHPIEILYDLLNYHLGVASTDIDTTSFLAFQTAQSTLKARAFLSQNMTVVDLINSLCFEFGIDLYALNGKYFVTSLTYVSVTNATTFTQDDFTSKSYTADLDQNRMYFNQVALNYNPNYPDGSFFSGLQIKNSQKISYHGTTTNFQYSCVWNHDEAQLDYRFGRLLSIASQPVKNVSFEAGFPAITTNPNDQIKLTYHVYSASPLIVRNINRDLALLKTKLQAWDIGTLQAKQWSIDAATVPSTYADALAATYAVYHGDYSVITGFNDNVSFTTDSTYLATLVAGDYATPELFAAEVQRAMNAVSTVRLLTVSYSRTTGKFTIITNGATNFTLKWTTKPEIGRSNLGFDVSSDSSGAATYSSAYIVAFDAVNQVSQWD